VEEKNKELMNLNRSAKDEKQKRWKEESRINEQTEVQRARMKLADLLITTVTILEQGTQKFLASVTSFSTEISTTTLGE